jgi:hypothetical protein
MSLQVQRVMQACKISPDELVQMIFRSALTRERGFNRKFYDWLFKVKVEIREDTTTVQKMVLAQQIEIGHGPHYMEEVHMDCNGEGCLECGWDGKIVRHLASPA